ncbi:RNA deprotection pyrophosphohydrolase [Rossellomorea vietnamensis]|uniref:RNA deprotection pyrophosphohydrolase n=1 Tax=Rossellomorea vietnamensis TaxID=218284 RepID=UPI003CF34D6E
MEKFLDYNGYEVNLSLGAADFPIIPKHVLVIAIYKGEWLLTRHKIRGLEFPGGKVEERETLEEAAKRELYEETGGKATQLIRIGTYKVNQQKPFAKAIFFAEVNFLQDKGDYLETDGPQIWSGDLKSVKEDDRFSFVMKDDVVTQSLKYLCEQGFIQK